ncbi:MAG: N-acetyltransferase [Christensenellaceae bacterium]|jgi:predicted N-acetyltransferase YhbS|nr:N-acetyltransferase [Christensenellaceae bacterium]
MRIRQEQPADYAAVYELVKISFAAAPHGDGTEADYLNEVRKKDTFIPELSFVAVLEDRIVGQIVLYKTSIATGGGARTELVLSPICVHPGCFGRGIATAMIEFALARAKELHYHAVFLCGAPDFYGKRGFVPTYEHGLIHIKDASGTAKWSMVRELYPGSLKGITGAISMD